MSFEEVCSLLMVVEASFVFVCGLVLRESRLDVKAMEGVGFCCRDAQGSGFGGDCCSEKERRYKSMLKGFQNMPKKTAVVAL